MSHENPYAGQGSVLLDIGGDVGALVVAMPSSMVGTEVEIEHLGRGQHHPGHHRHDHHHHRAHVAVVDRPVAHGTTPSLVFGELVEGAYALYEKGGEHVLLTARVTGGEVTFLDWPTHPVGAGEAV